MSYTENLIINKKITKFIYALLIPAVIVCNIALAHYVIPITEVNAETEYSSTDTSSSNNNSFQTSSLFAKYACLLDAESGRVLVGKDAYTQVPMASTTKIMTCIIALEYCNTDFSCTTSKYAASMPDVQLNAAIKETFKLNDLLYSLMLKSHNDTAVIIAENVAYQYLFNARNHPSTDCLGIARDTTYDFINTASCDSSFIGEISTEQSKLLVDVFARLMNHKAVTLGCNNTYFITPNGLDASANDKVHSTTARDLAVIMSYCIQNNEFLKITQAQSHSFGRYTVTNANAFLQMYPNIISGKTGFTNDAGYCYVCAYKDGDRTFIVTLLACGWPYNKTYKWQDSKKLLNYARESYYPTEIVVPGELSHTININNGMTDSITIENPLDYSTLICPNDKINVVINTPTKLNAPIYNGQNVGNIDVYINDELHKSIPLYSSENVEKKDSFFYIKSVLNRFLFIDK